MALNQQLRGEKREHVFTIDIGPMGHRTRVQLDDDDISRLLRGVTVRSRVNEASTVELHAAPGQHGHLMARLPESRVVVIDGRQLCPRHDVPIDDGCACRLCIQEGALQGSALTVLRLSQWWLRLRVRLGWF